MSFRISDTDASLNTANPPSKVKPTLVLLAGLLCDETVWSDVSRRLVDLVQVLMIDFTGFASIASMAEHVLARAPQSFILVGHSMGGRVALEVFRRAPDRVTALGLFNTGTHPTAAHEPASRGELVRLARDAGMRKLAEHWLPPMLDSAGSTSAEQIKRLTAMVERATPESFSKQIAALLDRPDAAAVLSSIHVPTLLLSATGDRWSPVAQHEDIQRHVPHASLIVIDKAGHMAPVEQPDAVAAAMRHWIASLGIEVDAMQRLAITLEIERTIIRYARLNDEGAFESLAHMYTEDGVFARPSDPDTRIRGRSAILASFKARPPRITRHVMANIDVTVDSSTRARAHSTVLLFTGEGDTLPAPLEATLVGTFDDVLQKTGDAWLFAQRLGALQLKT